MDNKVKKLLLQAKANIGQKEFQKALDDLEVATILYDKSPDAFLMQGKCYIELKNYQKAKSSYESALELRESDPMTLTQLYQVNITLKCYEEAIEQIDELIDIYTEKVKEDYKFQARLNNLYTTMLQALKQANNFKKLTFLYFNAVEEKNLPNQIKLEIAEAYMNDCIEEEELQVSDIKDFFDYVQNNKIEADNNESQKAINKIYQKMSKYLLFNTEADAYISFFMEKFSKITCGYGLWLRIQYLPYYFYNEKSNPKEIIDQSVEFLCVNKYNEVKEYQNSIFENYEELMDPRDYEEFLYNCEVFISFTNNFIDINLHGYNQKYISNLANEKIDLNLKTVKLTGLQREFIYIYPVFIQFLIKQNSPQENIKNNLRKFQREISHLRNKYEDVKFLEDQHSIFNLLLYSNVDDLIQTKKILKSRLQEDFEDLGVLKSYYDCQMKILFFDHYLDDEISIQDIIDKVIELTEEKDLYFLAEKAWLQFSKISNNKDEEQITELYIQEAQETLEEIYQNMIKHNEKYVDQISVKKYDKQQLSTVLKKIFIIEMVQDKYTNNHEKQINQIKNILELNNNDYQLIVNLGVIYFNLDKIEEALDYFKQAFILRQYDIRLNMLIYICFVLLKDEEEAFDFLQRISQGFSKVLWIEQSLTTMAFKRNQFRLAEMYINKALETFEYDTDRKFKHYYEEQIEFKDFRLPYLIKSENLNILDYFIYPLQEKILQISEIFDREYVLNNSVIREYNLRIIQSQINKNLGKLGSAIKSMEKAEQLLLQLDSQYLQLSSIDDYNENQVLINNILTVCESLQFKNQTIPYDFILINQIYSIQAMEFNILYSEILMYSDFQFLSFQRLKTFYYYAIEYLCENQIEGFFADILDQSIVVLLEHSKKYLQGLFEQQSIEQAKVFVQSLDKLNIEQYELQSYYYYKTYSEINFLKGQIFNDVSFYEISLQSLKLLLEKLGLSFEQFIDIDSNKDYVQELIRDKQVYTQIQPIMQDIIYNLYNILALAGQTNFELVLTLIQNTLMIYPESPELYALFSLCSESQDQKLGAAVQALKIDQSNQLAINILASYHINNSDYLQAIKFYQKLIEVNPSNAEAYLGLTAIIFINSLILQHQYNLNERVSQEQVNNYQQLQYLFQEKASSYLQIIHENSVTLESLYIQAIQQFLFEENQELMNLIKVHTVNSQDRECQLERQVLELYTSDTLQQENNLFNIEMPNKSNIFSQNQMYEVFIKLQHQFNSEENINVLLTFIKKSRQSIEEDAQILSYRQEEEQQEQENKDDDFANMDDIEIMNQYMEVEKKPELSETERIRQEIEKMNQKYEESLKKDIQKINSFINIFKEMKFLTMVSLYLIKLDIDLTKELLQFLNSIFKKINELDLEELNSLQINSCQYNCNSLVYQQEFIKYMYALRFQSDKDMDLSALIQCYIQLEQIFYNQIPNTWVFQKNSLWLLEENTQVSSEALSTINIFNAQTQLKQGKNEEALRKIKLAILLQPHSKHNRGALDAFNLSYQRNHLPIETASYTTQNYIREIINQVNNDNIENSKKVKILQAAVIYCDSTWIWYLLSHYKYQSGNYSLNSIIDILRVKILKRNISDKLRKNVYKLVIEIGNKNNTESFQELYNQAIKQHKNYHQKLQLYYQEQIQGQNQVAKIQFSLKEKLKYAYQLYQKTAYNIDPYSQINMILRIKQFMNSLYKEIDEDYSLTHQQKIKQYELVTSVINHLEIQQFFKMQSIFQEDQEQEQEKEKEEKENEEEKEQQENENKDNIDQEEEIYEIHKDQSQAQKLILMKQTSDNIFRQTSQNIYPIYLYLQKLFQDNNIDEVDSWMNYFSCLPLYNERDQLITGYFDILIVLNKIQNDVDLVNNIQLFNEHISSIYNNYFYQLTTTLQAIFYYMSGIVMLKQSEVDPNLEKKYLTRNFKLSLLYRPDFGKQIIKNFSSN